MKNFSNTFFNNVFNNSKEITMKVVARKFKRLRNIGSVRIDAIVLSVLIGTMFLSAANTGFAQEGNGLRFGLFGAGGFVEHRADFPFIPGTQSCCMSFTGGSGFGISGGGLLEWRLGTFLIGARLGVMTHPFDMTTEEGTFVIANGSGQEGAFNHKLTGSYMTAGIEPTVAVRLFNGLVVGVGATVGQPISGTFEQYEQLTQPSGAGTFLNADGTDSRKRTRNEFSGDLPGMKLRIAPQAGIGYELPMNSDHTLLLVPEVSYQLGLTDVLDGVDWKTDLLRVGVALKFAPGISKEPGVRREERRVVDTVRREVPVLAQTYRKGEEARNETRQMIDGTEVITETISRTDTLFALLPKAPTSSTINASIAAFSVGADGVERRVVRISVEEFSSTLMTPLLPYVFFDENSSAIPDRYARLAPAGVSAFNIDAVNSPETLPTYYHLLNIVGQRMKEHPAARLILTGTNQDRDEEKGKIDLSRDRAQSVKSYLTNVWGLDEKRIEIKERNLPEKAANNATDDGADENRRVEIASNDPSILFPIITRDTLRKVDPPVVLFRPTVSADRGTKEWQVNATQDGKTLKSFSGSGEVEPGLEWNLARQSSTIPRTSSPMAYQISAKDATGASAQGEGTIDVEQISIRQKRVEGQEDMQIDRFSLILFDVRTSELNSSQDGIIDLIREHIRPTSSVTATGYTDRLGDAAYNLSLGEARAASVAKALRSSVVKSVGVGEADLHNSNLPEARLYTRTVEVVVETPVE